MGCNMCVVQKPEDQYRVLFQVSFFFSLTAAGSEPNKPPVLRSQKHSASIHADHTLNRDDEGGAEQLMDGW